MTDTMPASEFVKKAKKPRKHEHTRLVHAIVDYLNLYPDKVYVWSNNTIATSVGKRFVRAGLKGSADIIGLGKGSVWLPGHPRWYRDIGFIAIECKCGKDKQSDEQIEFQKRVESLGGIYVLARSTDDVKWLVE